MKFAEFICYEAINHNTEATTKAAVLNDIIKSLAVTGKIKSSEADDIHKAVLQREELGNTGIGHGIAIPHAKHRSVPSLIGTLFISRAGIDYGSLDGEKVHLIFLLISSLSNKCGHMLALEAVSRQAQDKSFVDSLLMADSWISVKNLMDRLDLVNSTSKFPSWKSTQEIPFSGRSKDK